MVKAKGQEVWGTLNKQDDDQSEVDTAAVPTSVGPMIT